MKQLTIAFLIMLTCALGSCVEGLDNTFDEFKLVELEAAVRGTPAAGVIYPVVPVTRTSGAQVLQVNLVGAKLSSPQEMTFSIDTAIATRLNDSTIAAVEGTHYTLKGGKFTMGADSSFARINFDITNVPASKGKYAFLLLRLDGNSEIKASENYRRIGYRINLN